MKPRLISVDLLDTAIRGVVLGQERVGLVNGDIDLHSKRAILQPFRDTNALLLLYHLSHLSYLLLQFLLLLLLLGYLSLELGHHINQVPELYSCAVHELFEGLLILGEN